MYMYNYQLKIRTFGGDPYATGNKGTIDNKYEYFIHSNNPRKGNRHGCDVNRSNFGPHHNLVKRALEKQIQKTVRVSSSEYLMNKSSLNVAESRKRATFTGDVDSNNATITNVSVSVGQLVVGQTLTSVNIPTGTTIVRIDSPTQITMSANATASSSSESITSSVENVRWNQSSDRLVQSISTAVVPSRGNSTSGSITRLRPGSLRPGGKGVDVKHNSYHRYLARLKGRKILRQQPEPSSGNYEDVDNIKFNIVTSCAC